MRTFVLALLALLGLAGCSSSSGTHAIEIPSSAVTDTPHVPADIAEDYAALQSELDQDFVNSYDKYTDPDLAAQQPLARRRAFVYRYFDYGSAASEISITTFPGSEHSFDGVVDAIAAELDFRVTTSFYYGGQYWTSTYPQYRTTDYDLISNRALSAGELAWAADWIMQKYADKVVLVNRGSGDTDIVLPD